MHQHSHLCLTQSRTVIWDFYPSAESKTDTKAFPQKNCRVSQKPFRGLWSWSKACCSWEDSWFESFFSFWAIYISFSWVESIVFQMRQKLDDLIFKLLRFQYLLESQAANIFCFMKVKTQTQCPTWNPLQLFNQCVNSQHQDSAIPGWTCCAELPGMAGVHHASAGGVQAGKIRLV